MSDTEIDTNSKETAQPATAETSSQQSNTVSNMANVIPTLLSGLKLPRALKIDGNLPVNWKRFKRLWRNYAIIAILYKFEENLKAALFLSVIGYDTLKMFEGMDFAMGTDRQILSKIIEKFKEFCIGETNETYELCI
jgi:hypothetical protein